MQNVLEMVVLGESAARKITRLLTSQKVFRWMANVSAVVATPETPN